MDWAPVLKLSGTSGEEAGLLSIVEEKRVQWIRHGQVYREFFMELQVNAAVFAHFAHDTSNELWIVILLENQAVHSFATTSGIWKVMGLNLNPEMMLAWGDMGVVFTYVIGKRLHINTLEGPEELLQAVVPSTIMEPLHQTENLVFMDERVAVIWSECDSTVKIYSVKLLQHRNRSGTAVLGTEYPAYSFPDISGNTNSSTINSDASAPPEYRAAVLSPLREWSQEIVGTVFTQKLTENERGSSNWLVAIHDPIGERLVVLSGLDSLSYDRVKYATPIKGVHGVPLTAVLIENSVQIFSLFFPNSQVLEVPVARDLINFTKIYSEKNSNWIDIFGVEKSSTNNSSFFRRLTLFDSIDKVLQSCFSIIREVLGVQDMFDVLLKFLIQLPNVTTQWVAFRQIVSHVFERATPEAASRILLQFHLLREEMSLFETKDLEKTELECTLSPFVQYWSPGWRQTYEKTTDNPPQLSGYPCPIEHPPCVFESLIHNFDESIGEPLVDLSEVSQFYPFTYTLVRIFELLPTVLYSDAHRDRIKSLLESSRIMDHLSEFAFSIQACLLQIKELIDTTSEESQSAPPIFSASELLPSTLRDDRRYNEALNFLRVSDPQQCLYGILVDTEKFQAGEIMEIQQEWSAALSNRSLDAAFGRAALTMGDTRQYLWNQITSSLIDFSGVCTETGISIPPSFKGIGEAAKVNPWGVFAHGVALGLSVSPQSPGVNNDWVLTSTKIKAENKELFSGYVYGMGLAGHLKSLEYWQFYESLVTAESCGTLASLLGVAASQIGSRDTKLTKVLSVHIRALLPREMNVPHYVTSNIENGALLSLGLVYYKTGLRNVSDKLQRQLEMANGAQRRMFHASEMEQNEVHNFALGLSIGLINCGQGIVNQLKPLVSVVTNCHDENVESHERVNGALVALLCSFVGTNDISVARPLQYSHHNPDTVYTIPYSLFGRALAVNMIMWDHIGDSTEWVDEQCRFFNVKDELSSIRRASANNSIEGLANLGYFYWKTGTLIAMAMRHTGSFNEKVIDTLCRQIEDVYLPLYTGNLYWLSKSRRLDSQTVNLDHNAYRPESDDYHLDFVRYQFVKALAQMLSHLALSVSAVAAGSGNIKIMRQLRQLWQISPQMQAMATADTAQATEEDVDDILIQPLSNVGIDLSMIAQSVGWLFLSHGHKSFKNDPASVALLTCTNFVQMLGGGNLDYEQWRHVRFMWSLVTEERLLFNTENPNESVKVEIHMKSGYKQQAKMPVLLPPFDYIEKINITDDRFTRQTLQGLNEAAITKGIRVVPLVNHSVGLDIMLKKLQSANHLPQSRLNVRLPASDKKSARETPLDDAQTKKRQQETALITKSLLKTPAQPLGDAIKDMARYPQNYQDRLELTLLLSFYRHIRPSDKISGVFTDQWLEQTQLKSWLSQQAL